MALFLQKSGGDDLEVLGPSPAVLERIANEVRYSVQCKTISQKNEQGAS